MRRFTPLLIIGALLIFVFIIGIVYGDTRVTNSYWNPVEPPGFEDQASWSPMPPPGGGKIFASWSPMPPPGGGKIFS